MSQNPGGGGGNKKVTKSRTQRARDPRVSSAPSNTHPFFFDGELALIGRANTILGKQQGDHASSLAMVIRGITRIYRVFYDEIPPEIKVQKKTNHPDVSEIRGRKFFDLDESIRRRKKVVSFVIRLASIDTSSDDHVNLNRFISNIEDIFKEYKKHRTSIKQIETQLSLAQDPDVKKTYIEKQKIKLESILNDIDLKTKDGKINSILELFISDDYQLKIKLKGFLDTNVNYPIDENKLEDTVTTLSNEICEMEIDYAEQHVKLIKDSYKLNSLLVNNQAARIGAAAINYYNGLNVTFRPLESAKKIRPNDKNSEKNALQRLDKHFSWVSASEQLLKDMESKGETLSVTSGVDQNRPAAESWNSTMGGSTRTITGIDVMAKQIGELLDYCKIKEEYLPAQDPPDKANRTNNIELLVDIMARHLFLFFFSYPEVALEYGCDLEEDNPKYSCLEKISEAFGEFMFSKWLIPKAEALALMLAYKKKFLDHMNGLTSEPAQIVIEAINRMGLTPSKKYPRPGKQNTSLRDDLKPSNTAKENTSNSGIGSSSLLNAGSPLTGASPNNDGAKTPQSKSSIGS